MAESNQQSPKDPYNLVMFLFYYLAIGTLIPWNFFINVNSYWMYKFRTVEDDNKNNSIIVGSEGKNDLQLEFTSDLAIAAMIPNVLFLILNALFGHRFKTTARLLWSLCSVVVLFICAVVLVKVNTDSWQTEFLIITLTIVVFINIFASIFQGGLFGLAGRFPSKYMNAVLGGQGIGGVFAASVNVLLLALGGDGVSAAFYCFLLSIIFLVGSVFAFFIATRTEIYQYYMSDNSPADISETSPLINCSSDKHEEEKKVSVLKVLRIIWCEALTIFIIYIVTLGCFPGLTVLVESTKKDQPDSTLWENQFFVPVACFLFYNIGDYIGRFIAASPIIPTPSSPVALILSILRVVLIPLIILCNLAPNERLVTPVLISSDGAFIGLVFALAISNGWLTSIVMVSAPLAVPPHMQQATSNMMVGFLGLGLVSGAALSAALIKLL